MIGGEVMYMLISLSIGTAFGFVLRVLFGEASASLIGALVLMVIDLLTGLIKALLGHSDKSTGGRLSSDAVWQGILKKVAMISMIAAGQVAGTYVLGLPNIRDIICYSILGSELLSITENLGQCGVPIPEKLVKLIDVLKEKGEEENGSAGKSD